jgi:hypothetical protein
MDVDAARRKGEDPNICCRCRKPGHWAKECPLRFNVRFMSTEEVQEALEAHLVEADLSGVPAEEPAAVSEATQEDFTPRDA